MYFLIKVVNKGFKILSFNPFLPNLTNIYITQLHKSEIQHHHSSRIRPNELFLSGGTDSRVSSIVPISQSYNRRPHPSLGHSHNSSLSSNYPSLYYISSIISKFSLKLALKDRLLYFFYLFFNFFCET